MVVMVMVMADRTYSKKDKETFFWERQERVYYLSGLFGGTCRQYRMADEVHMINT